MNRSARLAGLIVLIHVLANFAHGYSHVRTDVPLEVWQQLFVLIVVFLAPIVAAILYWTKLRKAGAALLTVSMLAATVFGVYFHYIAETSDHVSHRHADTDGKIFVVTAALLVPIALIGAGFGAATWRRFIQDSIKDISPAK